MILSNDLFKIFKKYDLTFFTGVPDSTFADWMSFLNENNGKLLTNIISCNECEAIAACAGYYLARKKPGVAYMQNSGLGKTVNPLTSLCDKEIFSIPVLLMIGWRGEPGKTDAPQHAKMGKITTVLLEDLNIPYSILTSNLDEIDRQVKIAKQYLETNNAPYALIIKKGIVAEASKEQDNLEKYELTREEALKICIKSFEKNEIIVSTTGKLSRELYEYREAQNENHEKEFSMVGSMGCAASIGLSIALQKPKRKVVILDGDGAVIMQMGALATIGHYQPSNLIHIVFDNEAYESTGDQPSVSCSINLKQVALGCNYKNAVVASTKEGLLSELEKIKNLNQLAMLVIKVRKGSRNELGRPKIPLIDLKNNFIRYLEEND